MQISKGINHRKMSGVVTVAVLAGMLFTVAITPVRAATTGSHQAAGFGADVTVGSVVKLGPIALAEFPSCNTQNVGSLSATAASVNLAGLVSTGAVNSTASSTATSSTGTNDVVGINILDGLITASEIKASSTSLKESNGTFGNTATGSTFANLKVLGVEMSSNVAPNTVIELPLLGTVTLNEQISYVTGDEASFEVNMIDVKITLGPKAGTKIIVAGANSTIYLKNTLALVGGYAYAPQLVTPTVTSGPLVSNFIPCAGTGGAVESDTVASTNIPGVVSTGTVTVTGTGNILSTSATSQATSSIAGANLLSGLVHATAITGVASAETSDGVTFNFSGETTFVGLSVAGHPEITVEVAPNTEIAIANLGTLYFNRVERFSDKIRVVPIELIINATNTLGLPIGADLTLGSAEAQLHSATIP
jgi:hypothetical protein